MTRLPASRAKLTFQGRDMGQGLGIRGRVQQGPRKAGGKERSCGSHSSPQAGRERKSMSSRPCVPTGQPAGQGVQPAHLCWASRASFLLRAWSPGDGELTFLTGGDVTSAMDSLAPGSWSEDPLSVFLHLALRFWNQT